jgi:N-acylglucosamine 2-epimerase
MQCTTVEEYARFYESYLVEEVMAFWDPRTHDEEHGGFLISFDREGNLTATDKNTWCQGRQTYLYASLHRLFEERPQWLEFAASGRRFLVERAYAGEGRWRYLLDQAGRVKTAAPSYFTDCFALMGLSAYAAASGHDEDVPVIEATFSSMERNLRDPAFTEFHHFSVKPGLTYHGPHMAGLCAAQTARLVLGEERTAEFIDYCLEQILHVFLKEERQALFEVLAADGAVSPTPEGQTLNPGHAMESAWFCMAEGLHRKDEGLLQRAGEAAHWSWKLGHDVQHGGLLAFVDPHGQAPPLYSDEATDWGEHWDDKIWWVHSETMYAMALLALETRDAEAWEHFEELHEYTQAVFADRQHGEWFTYLNRDGSPRDTDKGNWIRCAFHMPRNVLLLALLLRRHAGQAPPSA